MSDLSIMQRYGWVDMTLADGYIRTGLYPCDDGTWVRYNEHAATVDALRARAEEAEADLRLALYASDVAASQRDEARAEVERLKADNARLRAALHANEPTDPAKEVRGV